MISLPKDKELNKTLQMIFIFHPNLIPILLPLMLGIHSPITRFNE
jgi:hypothetical protein